MSKTKSNQNAPVVELRDGLIRIAIFRNEPKQDGDRVRFSGKLTRSYQDAAGEWHDTDNFSSVEYLRAANLLVKAYNAELELRQTERGSAEPASEEPDLRY